MRFPSVPSRPRGFLTRLSRFAALAASAGVLWGCVFGGTGSDTENGAVPTGPSYNAEKNQVFFRGLSARVVDGDGAPVAGVTLNLYPPEFRPDSGLAPVATLASGAKQPKTDADGFTHIDLARAGKYVVEGVSAGQTIFFDTLAVPDARAALYTFRARPTGMFRGKVRLASGMRIDFGIVFIRGTNRQAQLDPAGNYDLGPLPVDAGRMALGLRYSASPTGVREVTQTDTSRGAVSINDPVPAPVYACNQLEGDSAKAALDGAPPSGSILDSGNSSAAVPEKLNAAVHSCDSLAGGTVVKVKPLESAGPVTTEKRDSLAISVIVLKQSMADAYSSSVPAIVPYAECVAPAGREQTLFGAQVLATADGNNLLVGDIAGKCLNP